MRISSKLLSSQISELGQELSVCKWRIRFRKTYRMRHPIHSCCSSLDPNFVFENRRTNLERRLAKHV